MMVRLQQHRLADAHLRVAEVREAEGHPYLDKRKAALDIGRQARVPTDRVHQVEVEDRVEIEDQVDLGLLEDILNQGDVITEVLRRHFLPKELTNTHLTTSLA